MTITTNELAQVVRMLVDGYTPRTPADVDLIHAFKKEMDTPTAPKAAVATSVKGSGLAAKLPEEPSKK